MRKTFKMFVYLVKLKSSKMILWCYLIWYLTMVFIYFDESLKIWINAIGVSIVVGSALLLIFSESNDKCGTWQIFRLYFTPFCVSSFSLLTKDWNFIVFLADNFWHNTIALFLCFIFLGITLFLKKNANVTD